MYNTVVKHDGHLRAREKCKKTQAAGEYFLHYSSVLTCPEWLLVLRCNTRLREGTYFLERVGLGPKKARNLKLNTKSYLTGGSQFFSRLFKKEFYDVAFHFSFYRLSFSFHSLCINFVFYNKYYVYYAMAHSFVEGLGSVFVLVSPYPRERSLCPRHPLSERAQSLPPPAPFR